MRYLPAVCLLLLLSACRSYPNGAAPDTDFDVTVATPRLLHPQPRVLYDEAHRNLHQLAGTYGPFGRLLQNDGCQVTVSTNPITPAVLQHADLFVTVTAKGDDESGGRSAYTDAEIQALHAWVTRGGAALIVTEHFPFSLAMAPLLARFDVRVHDGMTEDSTMKTSAGGDALQFLRSRGQLNGSHPITANLSTINTFWGSSLQADSTFTPLLLLSAAAQNFDKRLAILTAGGDTRVEVTFTNPHSAQGYCQGVCKEVGRGRLVVLAESAMLTAQIDKDGQRFGMNVPQEDNKQFVLNMIRWLVSR